MKHHVVSAPPASSRPSEFLLTGYYDALQVPDGITAKTAEGAARQAAFCRLTRSMAQLTELSLFAHQLLSDLVEKSNQMADRITAAGNRINTLKSLLPNIETKINEQFIPDQLVLERIEWHNDVSPECNLFTKETEDKFVANVYQICTEPPLLEVFDDLRNDNVNTLKEFTNPAYFFESWAESMARSNVEKEKARKQKLAVDKRKKRKDNKPIEKVSTIRAVDPKDTEARKLQISGPSLLYDKPSASPSNFVKYDGGSLPRGASANASLSTSMHASTTQQSPMNAPAQANAYSSVRRQHAPTAQQVLSDASPTMQQMGSVREHPRPPAHPQIPSQFTQAVRTGSKSTDVDIPAGEPPANSPDSPDSPTQLEALLNQLDRIISPRSAMDTPTPNAAQLTSPKSPPLPPSSPKPAAPITNQTRQRSSSHLSQVSDVIDNQTIQSGISRSPTKPSAPSTSVKPSNLSTSFNGKLAVIPDSPTTPSFMKPASSTSSLEEGSTLQGGMKPGSTVPPPPPPPPPVASYDPPAQPALPSSAPAPPPPPPVGFTGLKKTASKGSNLNLVSETVGDIEPPRKRTSQTPSVPAPGMLGFMEELKRRSTAAAARLQDSAQPQEPPSNPPKEFSPESSQSRPQEHNPSVPTSLNASTSSSRPPTYKVTSVMVLTPKQVSLMRSSSSLNSSTPASPGVPIPPPPPPLLGILDSNAANRMSTKPPAAPVPPPPPPPAPSSPQISSPVAKVPVKVNLSEQLLGSRLRPTSGPVTSATNDSRANLMEDIRKGNIKLRKVESKPRDVSKKHKSGKDNPMNEVAKILARRAALENSDSEDDSDHENNEDWK